MKKNKNVVVNLPCDGLENAVITSADETTEYYEKMTDKYIGDMYDDTPVGRVFFNVNYKRSCVPSETADSYLYNIKRGEDGLPIKDENGNSVKISLADEPMPTFNGKFRIMQQRNIDFINMTINAIKKRDMECWFSVRMNDHHNGDNPYNNSSFLYDNSEKLGVNGSKTFIDHTKEPVRNYYKNYIKELCENYDIDGIEFDFLRSCPIMAVVCNENVKLINDYVKELKAIVNEAAKKKNKVIQTAARVYPEEWINEEYGLDPVQWVADGTIDILIPEGWYVPVYFGIPVEKWRKSIDEKNVNKHPYLLLCGTDFKVKCDSTDHYGKEMIISLEQFKGFVSSAYQRGADGIYIFNHMTTEESGETYMFGHHGDWSYYIDENGNKYPKQVLKDKFCSANSQKEAETGMREYVHTCSKDDSSYYPIYVNDFKPFSFEINTGSTVKAENFTVLVGVDKADCYELSVSVNGVLTKQIDELKPAKDYEWQKSETAFETVRHVSEVAYRVLQFKLDDLTALKDGINKIIINGKGDEPKVIRWLGVRVNAEK